MDRFIWILPLLWLIGCEVLGSEPTSHSVIVGDYNAASIHRDHYWLRKAEVEGHELKLDITYGGGCGEHSFELYASGGWVKTNPPGKDIVLVHDGHGDSCEAAINEELRFEISQLKYPGTSEVLLFVWPSPGDSIYTPVPRYRS